MYIYIYIYIYTSHRLQTLMIVIISTYSLQRHLPVAPQRLRGVLERVAVAPEDFQHGRLPKFHRVFVGPRPWHIDIRHRVKKTSTINLFGFETLKLKVRRLKLWKPTAFGLYVFPLASGSLTQIKSSQQAVSIWTVCVVLIVVFARGNVNRRREFRVGAQRP